MTVIYEKDDPDEEYPLILIVEDYDVLNGMMRKWLRREGFRTEGVMMESEAIAKVIEKPDMLMVLDYLLPDMSGGVVIETLVERRRFVPLIVMTGHGDEYIGVDWMKLGARDYIVKYLDFKDQFSRIV